MVDADTPEQHMARRRTRTRWLRLAVPRQADVRPLKDASERRDAQREADAAVLAEHKLYNGR